MSAVMPQNSGAARREPAWRGALGARWNALAQRERRALLLAGSILAAALLWWLLLAPALTSLRDAGRQQLALEAQLQQMRALQAQARELQNAPTLGYDQALRALEAATKQRLGTSAQSSVLGERVTVTLRGANAESIARWLAQVRIDARALPSEVRLTRNAATGAGVNPVWDGTVVLSLPRR